MGALLPEMKAVETKELNVSKYIGTKAVIENLEIESGKHGQYLRVETNVLGKEDGVDIKASMLFGLKQTDNGLSISKSGELYKFMQSKKVADYRDLVGKDVIVISRTDDKGRTWLIFN